MNRSTFVRPVAAVSMVAALALGMSSPATASADTGAGLQAVKDAAHAAVTARVTALQKARAAIAASTSMGADQATETKVVDGDIAGLQQLDATVQAETTVAAARADATKVRTDFRIYVLVLPVAHMVRAADLVDNQAVPKLTAAATKLQQAITRRGATNLQPALDDMQAQIAAARQATTGLPATLEGFTPAQWNANHELLSPARQSLETARADVRKARADAKTIVTGLRRH